MLDFFKIINLIPAIRALIAEESLLPKNSHNKVPFALKFLKYILFVKHNKNKGFTQYCVSGTYVTHTIYI